MHGFEGRLAASDVAIMYLKTDKDLLVDPFRLVEDEMADVNGSIKMILGSDHPVLSAVAKYFFEHDGGKKVRPTMILLVAHAAEAHRAAVGSPLPAHQSVEFTLAAQQRIAEITYVNDRIRCPFTILPIHLTRCIISCLSLAR